MKKFAAPFFAGFVLVAALSLEPATAAEPVLRAETADAHLEAGDLLFNYLHARETWYARLIERSQRAMKAVSQTLFHRWMKKADPNLVHVAMYVGKGQLAEAHGTNPENAAVKIASLNDHPDERYLIVRPKDRALAARAAEIARNWAGPKRMKFLAPFHVPFRNISFGPGARKDALALGRDADRAGGPKRTKAMFCSQFVAGVYQAAIVAKQLAKKPKLKASDLRMPKSLQVHVAHTSVAALIASLRRGDPKDRTFDELSSFKVDPTLPPKPSAWAWLKSKIRKLFSK
jgi:hypothetical protein